MRVLLPLLIAGAATAAAAARVEASNSSSEFGPNGIDQASLGSPLKIACFGDSWASFACDTLKDVLHGHLIENQVENKGIPGLTASFAVQHIDDWVGLLLAADPAYIWLSLGGDDILDSGTQNSSVVNQGILRNMRILLNATFSTVPGVQIINAAYDFVNFVQSDTCLVYGDTVLPHCKDDTTCINDVFLSYKTDVLDVLAEEFPAFTVEPFFGTLQAAGGDKYTPPPYPNAAFPSPAYLMNDGCIHASSEGWAILMEFLYQHYFKGKFAASLDLPSATASPPAANGSLLTPSQRDWAYLNSLKSKGGGPDGLPWPPLSSAQAAALGSRAAGWQSQMEAANFRHGHVVDAVLPSRGNLSAEPVLLDTVGDSCTWTGTYLAAESFRFAATGDLGALHQAEQAMATLELLATCSSKHGYVVRAAMPATDPAYAAYYLGFKQGHYQCAPPLESLVWLGDSSRDSYTGFAFGLAAVQAALGDGGVLSLRAHPGTREAAAQLVNRSKALAAMVGKTLLADSWWISGPHGALTNPTPGFQAMWQQLALHSAPDEFAGLVDFNATFWLAAAVGSFDIKGMFEPEYFSNNLMLDSLFVVAGLDDGSDPTRTQLLQQWAMQIGAGAGTAHQLPTFAAIASCLVNESAVSAADAALMRGIAESALADIAPSPKWMETVDQALNPAYFPHHNSELSDHALLAGDRPGNAFLWQQAPVQLAGGVESPYLFATVDRLLPYWAGRLCGILPTPTSAAGRALDG